MCACCVHAGAEGWLKSPQGQQPDRYLCAFALCRLVSERPGAFPFFSLSTAQLHNFIKVTQGTRQTLPLQLPSNNNR